MATYHAYKPRKDGSMPMGTEDHIVRHNLVSDAYVIRYALKHLGKTAIVLKLPFGNFYDDKAWKQIHPHA